MKKYIIYCVSIILLIALTGCPEELPEVDKFMILINNSDEDIIWYSVDHLITSDTSNVNESYPWRNAEDFKIAKGDTFYQGINVDSYSGLIDDGWTQYY